MAEEPRPPEIIDIDPNAEIAPLRVVPWTHDFGALGFVSHVARFSKTLNVEVDADGRAIRVVGQETAPDGPGA